MMDLDLTATQKRIIGSALTLLAAAFTLLLAAVLVYWVARFLMYFSSVLMPIAVAGILALVLKPYYEWLRERLGQRSFLAVAVVFVSILLPLIAFFMFFGGLLWRQLVDLFQTLYAMAQGGWTWLVAHWPELLEHVESYELDVYVKTFLEERGDLLASGLLKGMQNLFAVGASALGFFAGLFSWAVFPLYLGFFLATRALHRSDIEALLPFLKQQTRNDVIYLGTEFVNILVSFFRGQLLVALMQGVLYAIGFSLIGLQYGFVLGLLLGFLNIIPYLGSIVGLAITIPLGLFQVDGSVGLAIAVVVVFTVVQTIESYLLTPRIMGDRTGLHPLAIIVAVFFWGTAFGGIWGMILAIPLTAFGVVFWRLLKEKYIREVL